MEYLSNINWIFMLIEGLIHCQTLKVESDPQETIILEFKSKTTS